jgi:DNA-binding FrmR family transcriptional regulator
VLSPIPAGRLGLRTEAAVQLRLLRAQLDEITCLLGSQAPCPQVLSRIFAAQVALHTVQQGLVHHHLDACLQRLAQVPDEAAAQQLMTEIQELYGARRKPAFFTPARVIRAKERGD